MKWRETKRKTETETKTEQKSETGVQFLNIFVASFKLLSFRSFVCSFTRYISDDVHVSMECNGNEIQERIEGNNKTIIGIGHRYAAGCLIHLLKENLFNNNDKAL